MKNDHDFKYNYSAPTAEERREIESIRNSYISRNKKDDKLSTLRKLHSKAKSVPKIISLTIGIIGLLIFGLGLTLILEWNSIAAGILVGAVGIIIMIANYPIFVKISNDIKNKYSKEILDLSEELLQNGKN